MRDAPLRNTLYDTAEIQKKDNHVLHPWEIPTTIGENKRTVIAEGHGVYVTDSDGHKLLDGPAGMWCVNIGHQRQEMADAISEQVMRLTYATPWAMTNAPAAKFAAELIKKTPGDLNNVSFVTCGSTAVDSAVRFMHFYNNCLGRVTKKKVISRAMGYHGSTFVGGTLSGKPLDRHNIDFADGLCHQISSPNAHDRVEGQSVEDFCTEKVDELENAILKLGADNVGMFIAEPVLASGGVIVPPDGYFKRCKEVCEKYDVLFVADEVVTAFGRLGHWFASEDVFGVIPDMITTAKGLTSGYIPMGALFISDRLIDQIKETEGGEDSFPNGYTYSGHPVAAAAGLKNLEIIEREGLLENARMVGEYFQTRLRELLDIPMVTEVRGVGLMGAVDCLNSGTSTGDMRDIGYDIGARIDKHCQELGLIVRPLVSMCIMSPPLTITKAQIDEMLAILRQGIELTQAEIIAEGIWSPE